jgi:hypothetical protein
VTTPSLIHRYWRLGGIYCLRRQGRSALCSTVVRYSDLLAHFPYFEKVKVVLCDLHPLCILLYLPLNAWTDPCETWFVCHGTWAHLSGVFQNSLPSVSVSVCVSLLLLLSKGSVYTFPLQRIHETKDCWTRRFLWSPCRDGESLGLPMYPPIVAR